MTVDSHCARCLRPAPDEESDSLCTWEVLTLDDDVLPAGSSTPRSTTTYVSPQRTGSTLPTAAHLAPTR
jgi:hypothetical protein